MSQTKPFVIVHILPSEKRIYHVNSDDYTVSYQKSKAMVFNNEIEETITMCRKTLEYVWKLPVTKFGGGDLKKWEGWEGCTLDEIKTTFEYV
jgi:hypothetical protein